MRRFLYVLAPLLIAACTTVGPNAPKAAKLGANADVTISGLVNDADGKPIQGGSALLKKGTADLGDMIKSAFLPNTAAVGADGKYAFKQKGSEINTLLNTPFVYWLEVARADEATVIWGFTVSKADMKLPTAQIWDAVEAQVDGEGDLAISWTTPAKRDKRTVCRVIVEAGGTTAWMVDAPETTKLTAPGYAFEPGAEAKVQVVYIAMPFQDAEPLLSFRSAKHAAAIGDAYKDRMIPIAAAKDSAGDVYTGLGDGDVEMAGVDPARPPAKGDKASSVPSSETRTLTLDLGGEKTLAGWAAWGGFEQDACTISAGGSKPQPMGSATMTTGKFANVKAKTVTITGPVAALQSFTEIKLAGPRKD